MMSVRGAIGLCVLFAFTGLVWYVALSVHDLRKLVKVFAIRGISASVAHGVSLMLLCLDHRTGRR